MLIKFNIIILIIVGSDIMKGDNPPQHHPASLHIAQYCIDQLQHSFESGGVTTVLHILTLLEDIFHHLPKAQVKVFVK